MAAASGFEPPTSWSRTRQLLEAVEFYGKQLFCLKRLEADRLKTVKISGGWRLFQLQNCPQWNWASVTRRKTPTASPARHYLLQGPLNSRSFPPIRLMIRVVYLRAKELARFRPKLFHCLLSSVDADLTAIQNNFEESVLPADNSIFRQHPNTTPRLSKSNRKPRSASFWWACRPRADCSCPNHRNVISSFAGCECISRILIPLQTTVAFF